jgi:hypothetical protein
MTIISAGVLLLLMCAALSVIAYKERAMLRQNRKDILAERKELVPKR